MYRYDEFDHLLVKERVAQFRGQVKRRLSGALSEDQFKPLRLMNGLYLQLHAYMLRIAIPYGTLSSQQMRKLAFIARKYDRGYGHFTTRQNIQLNWPKLAEVPDILDELAQVDMHCIQTSGNCIRNVTADHYAGVIEGEVEDPRIWSEIIRQWSSFHPEFSFLPRKFKIAVSGSSGDRAAILVHDIGIRIIEKKGETGFAVYAGGGQGRTPMIAKQMAQFVKKEELLPFLEAILRVYNQYGRRDNLFKARIKILVAALGEEKMRQEVHKAFEDIQKHSHLTLPKEEEARIKAYFAAPPYQDVADIIPKSDGEDKEFDRFIRVNCAPHKVKGYIIVNISLKAQNIAPGDMTDTQMDAIADLAEQYNFGEIRVSHEQNLTLAHIRKSELYELWLKLKKLNLATANIGLIADQITCPGLDFCNLANARSIPIALNIANHFSDLDLQEDIGEMKIKISGCMNACGHHHVGHIGILGVDKKGVEHYQISLGGSADENAALGQIIGPSFTKDDIIGAIDNIVSTYRAHRKPKEKFLETWRRIGSEPFKDNLYEETA